MCMHVCGLGNAKAKCKPGWYLELKKANARKEGVLINGEAVYVFDLAALVFNNKKRPGGAVVSI